MRKTFASFLLCSAVAGGQQPATVTERSYTRAREVLEHGLEAFGGSKTIQSIENIRFASHGTVPENGQSANPDASFYVRPADAEGVLDLLHRRYYVLRRTNYIGSGSRPSSVVTTDQTGFTADLRSNAVYPLAPAAVATNNKTLQRSFPFLLVQSAIGRAGTLRWVGEDTFSDRAQNVISFIDTDGRLFTLFFDAATGLLTKTEELNDTLLKGLSAGETIFADYRPVSGIMAPHHVVARIGEDTTSNLRYTDITVNGKIDASVFDPPKNSVTGPQVGGARQPITLTTLGKDVYYVDGIETGGIFFYSSLIVAFKDYVLVVESPLSDGVSQAVIAKIKETIPGKPIRYLVPTHYHVDHSGGLRGYVAEGATVLTTPGNATFIEHVAAIQHPLNSDRLSLHPRAPQIETFKGKRVLSDGERVVELYDVGPTPHVDEMVIVYLPQDKLLFVSDLFLVSYMGKNGPAEPSTVLLGDKIRALGLDVKTIAGGHGRVGTIDELRQSLAEKPAPAR